MKTGAMVMEHMYDTWSNRLSASAAIVFTSIQYLERTRTTDILLGAVVLAPRTRFLLGIAICLGPFQQIEIPLKNNKGTIHSISDQTALS
ncbi:uncharacterized protein FOMMEDRAFT_22201 [Fomitiporia mediterranea MF3/22]|uniref:uncharacterized protein n=1 Tax=Fomitiporia mediterranea (strain MF3/22) TaxID=694068 RepID=UPI0004408F31|nr:uncharacterized protein FOMMEDRAFT_22201 [Fomitiporia mediterranea MF3/22]EJD00380.1 hypothetical protein FOMMEDRAFT_22201 [Fomitiporia mediterranea MF3/22]